MKLLIFLTSLASTVGANIFIDWASSSHLALPTDAWIGLWLWLVAASLALGSSAAEVLWEATH